MFRIYIFILIPVVYSTGLFFGDHRESKMQNNEPMLAMTSTDYDNSDDTDDMQYFMSMPILRTENTDNFDDAKATQKPANEGFDSLTEVFRSIMSMFTNEEMKKPIIPKIFDLITNKTQFMIAKAKEKSMETAQQANTRQHTARSETEAPQWNIGDAIYKFLFGIEAPKVSRTDVGRISHTNNAIKNKTHYRINGATKNSTETTQHAKTQRVVIAPSVTQKPRTLGDIIYRFFFGKNTPRIFRTDNGSPSRTYNDPDSGEQNFNQPHRSSESIER